jgi:hypothetical protein
MPRPDTRPPGPGDIHIPLSRQPAPKLRRRRRFTPRVTTYVTRWWNPHPVSVYSAVALGDLYGRGINGHAGTISTEASRNGVGKSANPATGWTGYTDVPQGLFTGWNPAYQKDVGTPIKDPSGLPNTSVPGGGSPLDAATAAIFAGSND